MVELLISFDVICDVLKDFVVVYEFIGVVVIEVGIVIDVVDGIVYVEGFFGVMVNEFVIFVDGIKGFVLNFDEYEIGVVVFGDFIGIEVGQEVICMGEVFFVLVGDGYLGCVVDLFGNLIDGFGLIVIEGVCEFELQVFGVMQCKFVYELMQIGIKVIDVMILVGCGQCQLIIGDCQIGKMVIVIDMIINQKVNWELGDVNKQVCCIYVVIGQKGLIIVLVKGVFEEVGVLEYIMIVVVLVFDFVGFKYFVFYMGLVIGQYWMYGGKYVFIIFDDLLKQVEVYCVVFFFLCCLLGCEVYLGDVFYLYLCLLECCVKLFDEFGVGFMMGFLIIEIKVNDVLVYILINVILIIDGQIFLQFDFFNVNQCLVVDVGILVLCVGGDVQVKFIKKVFGMLKLELVQYCLFEVFVMFVLDFDVVLCCQLLCGVCLIELFKQLQYLLYFVEEQVVLIWVGMNGKFDLIEVEDVLCFECELFDYLCCNIKVFDMLCEINVLDDDMVVEFDKQMDNFFLEFQGGKGYVIGVFGYEEYVVVEVEDVNQEKIVKGCCV